MNKLLFALLAAVAFAVHAQTTVKDAWVRGTVAGQKATGLFAQISSAGGGRLVSASSPVAGAVEVHEMAMDGNVMRMRAVPAVELPAGKTVDFKPGGYHLMLLELKKELKAGDDVPVTLVIEGAGGQRENVEIKAPVKALAEAQAQSHKH